MMCWSRPERRSGGCGVLPSRTGVYFVLALGLFPHQGYLRVWGKLTAGLAGPGVSRPSGKALRDLRRLGPRR